MTMQLRHIVRQAQRGNQEAAQKLLTQFEPLISRQVAKYRHHYQSEAEARSTAHSAAIECIYGFDLSQRASVPQQMQACIHNAFAREAYHQKRYETMVQKDFVEEDGCTDLPSDYEDKTSDRPDTSLIRRETMGDLDTLMQILPPRNREYVYLRVQENWTYRKIASKYGVSESLVRKIIKQALAKLRKHLS